MTRLAKDCAALGASVLAVLTFIAVDSGWNVPLVGDNARWAAVAMLFFGAIGCAFGDPAATSSGDRVMPILGTVALVLGVTGIITGSLTALALLAADIALLWSVAALRHARAHHTAGPIAH
jgi:hypothetical protein